MGLKPRRSAEHQPMASSEIREWTASQVGERTPLDVPGGPHLRESATPQAKAAVSYLGRAYTAPHKTLWLTLLAFDEDWSDGKQDQRLGYMTMREYGTLIGPTSQAAPHDAWLRVISAHTELLAAIEAASAVLFFAGQTPRGAKAKARLNERSDLLGDMAMALDVAEDLKRLRPERPRAGAPRPSEESLIRYRAGLVVRYLKRCGMSGRQLLAMVRSADRDWEPVAPVRSRTLRHYRQQKGGAKLRALLHQLSQEGARNAE